MKKIILFASFVGASIVANAQVSFGPVVGIGVQGPRTYTKTDNSTTVVTLANGKSTTTPAGPVGTLFVPSAGTSFKIGVQAKIDMSKFFAISTGLTYQTMGYKIAVPGVEFKGKYNYLSVPIIAQVQYPINDMVTVGLGVGPEINFFVGGKETMTFAGKTFKTKVKGKGSIDESVAKETAKLNSDTDDNNDITHTRPLNIVLNIAPFVQFSLGGMKLLVTPTYYIGLSDIAPDSKYSTSTTTSGVTVTNNVDQKESIKTGGFGLNVSLLFGGNK